MDGLFQTFRLCLNPFTGCCATTEPRNGQINVRKLPFRPKLSDALTDFDPKLPIQLACDASSYGMGAVVSHIIPNGVERSITLAHAHSALQKANMHKLNERHWVFGVQKFHQYLFGRKFILLTDHFPLTTIFGLYNGIPPMVASQMQRWALMLSAHTIKCRWPLEATPASRL